MEAYWQALDDHIRSGGADDLGRGSGINIAAWMDAEHLLDEGWSELKSESALKFLRR